MQTPDSQEIVRRFFDALYRLKADRKIRAEALVVGLIRPSIPALRDLAPNSK